MNRTDFIKSSVIGLAGISIAPNILASNFSSNKSNPVFIAPHSGKEYQLPNMKITVKSSDKESNGEFEIFEEIKRVVFNRVDSHSIFDTLVFFSICQQTLL